MLILSSIFAATICSAVLGSGAFALFASCGVLAGADVGVVGDLGAAGDGDTTFGCWTAVAWFAAGLDGWTLVLLTFSTFTSSFYF